MTEQLSASSVWKWPLVQRRFELAALWRISWLRVFALLSFFAIETAYYLSHGENAQVAKLYRYIAVVCACWGIVSGLMMWGIMRRQLPQIVKYLSVCIDVGLLTFVAAITSGVSSPLLMVYPLIIILTVMAFDVRLVWCGTIACLVGYYLLVGQADPTWFDSQHTVPLLNQAISVAALLIVGIIGSLVCRQVERLTQWLVHETQSHAISQNAT